jgi:rare lipoprotein A
MSVAPTLTSGGYALILAGVLAGCSSTPTRAPPVPAGSGASGGYFQDDGPGERAAPSVDVLPDPTPRVEPLHRFANRPYTVMGRQYLPRTGLTEFRERGMASWYGRKFHGRNTSSGEPYDMYGLTAAHPTLPIPSYVRVTHVRSARSVVVRVNDRGPFLGDRIIDLSFTAASRLGYLQSGTAEVEVELLASPDGWSPAAMARSASSLNEPTIESIIEDRLGRGGTAP